MNCEDYGICEADYAIWRERATIADCLSDLGMNELAKKVHQAPVNKGIIEKYLSIIIKTANTVKHNDVLDRLYSAGLIYG